ncbi:hypothetical protein PUN28_010017 [Cardiocondyla obscurior]|uniref:Uncharacterized protein n=1 Tax=Cardiocondyla obscurior TaxID=286306 RepID=A0AAW2FQ11_9HYME
MAGVVCLIFFLLEGAAAWTANITSDITVHMNQVTSVPFSIYNASSSDSQAWITGTDSHIATSSFHITNRTNQTSFNGILNVTGVFLGRTKLTLIEIMDTLQNSQEVSLITVVREERTIDHIFTASVAILVSILYINFGCAMDWSVCRNTLRKPIGPAIGFFCQFLIMPVVYFINKKSIK